MSEQSDFLNSVDKTNFSTDSKSTRVEKPWGHELLLSPPEAPYTFKIMHIVAGARQSMQVHDAKSETYTVVHGEAAILIENSQGEMIQVELLSETGFTTQIGQRHRLIGLTDCDIYEASTPEIGITYRLEDDYSRPDETEAMRAAPNRGWKD